MQISGEWLLCEDEIERPVIRGWVLAGDSSRVPAAFLVDVGADRTVLSADILAALHLQPIPTDEGIGGVGGRVDSVVIETTIHLPHGQGATVEFRGRFAAVTDMEALDMSVLGRDITRLFAVIVDQPGDVVCLLGQRHRYVIIED
jgi:hypothetical protein